MKLTDIITGGTKGLTSLATYLSWGKLTETEQAAAQSQQKKTDPLLEYYYSLNEIFYKLPFISQAVDVKKRLIFSQGYDFQPRDEAIKDKQDDTTKKKIEEDRKKLKELFNRPNDLGETLDDLIADCIEQTEAFGHAGIQSFDWTNPETIVFQKIDWNQFLIITNKLTKADRGRKKVIYYYVSRYGFRDEKGIKLVIDSSSAVPQNESADYYKLIPIEFTHFRLNHRTLYGLSPLFNEQLMIKFIIDAINNNLEELNGHGWKGLLLKGRKGLSPKELGIALDEGEDNWQNKVVQKFMKQLRETASDDSNKQFMMYLNGALVEDVIQAQKNYSSVEYMDKVNDKAAVIAASLVGIHTALIGDRDSTYASNTKPIIEYTVNYSITPSQTKYAEFITQNILNRYINGRKYLNYDYDFVFNPIDLSDPKVEAETMKTIGEFVDTLRKNGSASVNEAIKFINDKLGTELKEVEEEEGDIKTTSYEGIPLNFEPTVEDTEPSDEPTDEEEPEDDSEEEVE